MNPRIFAVVVCLILSPLLAACPSDDDGEMSPSPDLTPPPPVTSLQALFNRDLGVVDLSWTLPDSPDIEGVLVVRSLGTAVSAEPEVGALPSVDDVFGDAGVVLFAGAGTETADEGARPGFVHYAAWTYDASLNFGSVVRTRTALPLDPQNADIEIDIADLNNLVATVTLPPPDFGLTASAGLRPAELITDPDEIAEIVWTARTAGPSGNDITVSLLDGGNGTPIAVNVVGRDILVSFDLQRHYSDELAAAVNASPTAGALVRAQAKASGNRILTIPPTPLTGGSDTSLRVELEVVSKVARQVFNLKLIPESTNSGVIGTRNLLPSGENYDSFGTRALDPGGAATASFDVLDFNPGINPVRIRLVLQDAPTLFAPGSAGTGVVAVDSSGSGTESGVSSAAISYRGTQSNDSRFQGPALAAEGGSLYLGNRNLPVVVQVDLASLQPTLGAELFPVDDVPGFVDGITMAPDDSVLYAVATAGNHMAAFGSPGAAGDMVCAGPLADQGCASYGEQVDLVKLSVPDLEELGRVTLITDSTSGARGRAISLSADGRIGAVAIHREGLIYLINTEDLSIIDAGGPGGAIDVRDRSLLVRFAAMAPDGGSVYLSFNDQAIFGIGSFPDDGTLERVDLSDFSRTVLSPPEELAGTWPGFLFFGPDARLYWGRKNDQAVDSGRGLTVYDPADGSWTDLPIGLDMNGDGTTQGRGTAAVFSADGSRLFVFDHGNAEISIVDPSGATPPVVFRTLETGNSHGMAITPF